MFEAIQVAQTGPTTTGDVLVTILQTGAVGAILWYVLTQLNASIKELGTKIDQQTTDIKIVLDRAVRAQEQVAREATQSRQDVIEHFQRVAEQIKSQS